MKSRNIFYSVVNTVIRWFLVLIVAGLLLQSMFSTSFVGIIAAEGGGAQERTLNIADDPWRHFLVFAGFTVLAVLFCHIRKRFEGLGSEEESCIWNCLFGRRGYEGDDSKTFRLLSVFVLLLGGFWILITQLEPGSDPAKVYEIAMQWRAGNFSAYAEGGYLFRYPYQAGIILFYYFLSFVFGVDNYIGLQLVNVIALVVVYVLLSKLAAFFWKEDKRMPVLVYVALILWLPLAFYVTYLYGILPGMALSLGAMYYVAKYLDTGKYRYILPACICMGLATVIKMNCVIYLIAAGCFLVYDVIDTGFSVCRKSSRFSSDKGQSSQRNLAGSASDEASHQGMDYSGMVLSGGGENCQPVRNGRRGFISLAVIGLMGLSVLVCNEATNRYVEHLSGYEAGEGQVMLSWVVMGLQETPLGPGGYSGYIGDIYVKYDYDTEKVKEASWTDIKKVIKRMSENPLDEGVTFFARKNAFQWNDPTFISLDRTKGRHSAIEVPEFAVSLIEGRGSVVFYVLMNYAQTLLLLGMLLYLFLNWKSKNMYELMGAVVFLGGYLFHFIWESSASYTIPYFVVMIPYGVKGLIDWVRYVVGLPAFVTKNCNGAVGKQEVLRKIGVPVGGIVVAAVLVTLLGRTNLFYQTIALNDGEEAQAQFYHENEAAIGQIPDGYYTLVPYVAQDKRIAEKDGKVTLVSLEPEGSNAAGTDPGKAMDKDGMNITVFVPAVDNIDQKLLFHRESAGSDGKSGISMRFRSNEQVLALEKSGGEICLDVYMDDGMNMFYEEKENVAYLWNVYGTPENGYYIVIDGMALTCREGEALLEELAESEEQRWLLK